MSEEKERNLNPDSMETSQGRWEIAHRDSRKIARKNVKHSFYHVSTHRTREIAKEEMGKWKDKVTYTSIVVGIKDRKKIFKLYVFDYRI